MHTEISITVLCKTSSYNANENIAEMLKKRYFIHKITESQLWMTNWLYHSNLFNLKVITSYFVCTDECLCKLIYIDYVILTCLNKLSSNRGIYKTVHFLSLPCFLLPI
jgi:hypothetical protein